VRRPTITKYFKRGVGFKFYPLNLGADNSVTTFKSTELLQERNLAPSDDSSEFGLSPLFIDSESVSQTRIYKTSTREIESRVMPAGTLTGMDAHSANIANDSPARLR
jgi:hypothetical protein